MPQVNRKSEGSATLPKCTKSGKNKTGRKVHRLERQEYGEACAFIKRMIKKAGLGNATRAGLTWAKLAEGNDAKLFLRVLRPGAAKAHGSRVDGHKEVPLTLIWQAVDALFALDPVAFDGDPVAETPERLTPRWWPTRKHFGGLSAAEWWREEGFGADAFYFGVGADGAPLDQKLHAAAVWIARELYRNGAISKRRSESTRLRDALFSILDLKCHRDGETALGYMSRVDSYERRRKRANRSHKGRSSTT